MLPYFPRKPYPIPDKNGQSLYPFSDQNGAKTIPFHGTYLYALYKGVPPRVELLLLQFNILC